jgi:hypothetical protein
MRNKKVSILGFSLCLLILGCTKEEPLPLAWLIGKWKAKEVVDYVIDTMTYHSIYSKQVEIGLDSKMIVTDSLGGQKDTVTYLCNETLNKIYFVYEMEPYSYYPTAYDIISRSNDAIHWERTKRTLYLNSQLDTITEEVRTQWYLTRM